MFLVWSNFFTTRTEQIQQVLLTTNQSATVEAILDMNGNPHGSQKDLTFKVRWSGRDDRDDSWETYSNLRHNAILHEFLIANKLRKLIPK